MGWVRVGVTGWRWGGAWACVRNELGCTYDKSQQWESYIHLSIINRTIILFYYYYNIIIMRDLSFSEFLFRDSLSGMFSSRPAGITLFPFSIYLF